MTRVDSLKSGQKFRCVSDKVWTFVRQHGSNSGAFIVVGEDGREECFAGCAEVTPVQPEAINNGIMSPAVSRAMDRFHAEIERVKSLRQN